jgi:hypothetical protein
MARAHKRERGIALVTVAIFLTVIFGFTALGIDIARLAHTATEVQTVADVAARSGAAGLLATGGVAGTGITRAHLVANTNEMNGATVTNADVLVDEGHYNFADDQFECCTSNTPCCKNGSWGDLTCTAGGACDTRSAVLATPATTVDNLIAGFLDFVNAQGQITSAAASGSPHKTTKVTKIAVAAPTGPGAGCQTPAGCNANDWACYCNHGVAPCLPITAPSCEFPPNCSGAACQLPALHVGTNNTDTAAWTGFNAGHSDSTIRSYLSQGPCQPPGQSTAPPATFVDGTIDVTNGVNSNGTKNVFSLTECLRANNQGCRIDANGKIIGSGGTVFQIPIVDFGTPGSCSTNFTGNQTVAGFATIRIDSVVNRVVNITTLGNSTDANVQAGGSCFGTECRITMAR